MLCTHDYFTVDGDGDLYFVDRSDDIIKTRGEKVSSVEVENVLHDLDGVRQAAVVGVPDELLGQAVRAFVVLQEGATLTEKDLIRACRARLENFMVPRDVVFVGRAAAHGLRQDPKEKPSRTGRRRKVRATCSQGGSRMSHTVSKRRITAGPAHVWPAFSEGASST